MNNKYADEMLDALQRLELRGRSFKVWLKDSNNFGKHEDLELALEEWMLCAKNAIQLAPLFWEEQKNLQLNAPLDMDELGEMLL